MEEKTQSYFRVKTEFLAETTPGGALERKKIEELVLATCYTEVETLVHEIIDSYNRTQFGSVSYEIIKTKVPDVLFNDILAHSERDSVKGFVCNYFEEEETSGVGLYAVKVIFITIDEKSFGVCLCFLRISLCLLRIGVGLAHGCFHGGHCHHEPHKAGAEKYVEDFAGGHRCDWFTGLLLVYTD